MGKHIEDPLVTPEELAVAPYDTVEFLTDDELIAEYFSVNLLENFDPDIFLGAIGNILRAKGLNTLESLLKISEEMRAPVEPAPAIPARKKVKTGAKTAAKRISAKKKSTPSISRRKREAVPA